MTAFRQHDDVAVVECDPATGPFEGGEWWPGTVAEVKPWSARARLDGGGERLFLLDSRGRAWRDGGRLQLVPLCRCERPILGTPVTDPEDRAGRLFCSEGCLTAEAEACQEQHYPSGVAT